MASNRFGNLFTMTTFGESHGKGIGVVIDGCPAGVEISREEIQADLDRRRPGTSPYTSPRKETDQVEILSGLFEGRSTGAPIALFVNNIDVDSSKYEPIKDLLRPGHANYTYFEKYGIFDYQGGGRSSGRETLARVAAGSVAKKVVFPMKADAIVEEVGGVRGSENIEKLLREVMEEGDSVGGIVGCTLHHVPASLGEPVYQKMEALIGFAMLSIPATKGVEFGEGFRAATMRGSNHNDPFVLAENGGVTMSSNHHGGTLGGITTGSPIYFRVAFKPTSSIQIEQKTVDKNLKEATFKLPFGSRHDPCIALRTPVIIESMAYLVLADLLLMNRCSKI